MAQNYDRVDLAFSSHGDWIIGHDGGLMDTDADPLRSIVQEILSIVKSELGSWRLAPNRGASLSDFVGETNDKATAERIKTRILSSLTKNGLVNSHDLKIIYAPIDREQLMVRIGLSVMPTVKNAGSTSLGISVVYNFSENNINIVKGL